MKTMTVIARIPLDYKDFGQYALNEAGEEKFDELIAELLPDEASWCGDEILAPVDADIDIDINEIISAASEKMLNLSDEYWEEW